MSEILKIVLADDDESDRINFVDAFDELKIKSEVQTVKDGVELMDYLKNTDAVLPDLIFLDLNMPRKNGLECLKEIRESAKLKEIIIAIYSTSSSEKDIDATLINGANVYIKKPNDFSTLKQVLDKVVRAAYAFRTPPFNIENFIFRL